MVGWNETADRRQFCFYFSFISPCATGLMGCVNLTRQLKIQNIYLRFQYAILLRWLVADRLCHLSHTLFQRKVRGTKTIRRSRKTTSEAGLRWSVRYRGVYDRAGCGTPRRPACRTLKCQVYEIPSMAGLPIAGYRIVDLRILFS